MNVHIVCVDDGHIVPRMARWLADAHAWTMSDRPRHDAALNHYMPYTAIVQGRVGTPTAAWFTHEETTHPGKMRLWERAAYTVDFRLITAPIYSDLKHSGPTERVTPGVDRDHFRPDPRMPVLTQIGMSGIAGERKAPHLARRLYDDGYDVAAIGRGWPVPTANVTYDEIPDFYRTLDVLLCTSLVEGIPAPPLEALACGTKVVVPWDVGCMSELPENEGIRHYEPGDYGDMVRAVEQALADNPDPGALRNVTRTYSKAAWCESHERAFAEILQGVPA